MQKIHIDEIEELSWKSPKGTFEGFGKQLSEALGRDARSMDLEKRHPFDVELARVAPGGVPFPYHSHSAQWEFYYVLSGSGIVRDEDGRTRVGPGDAFLFKPGEAHQLINDGQADFTFLVIADNPVGESVYYPDSQKWGVRSPQRRLLRSEPLDYYDGEE